MHELIGDELIVNDMMRKDKSRQLGSNRIIGGSSLKQFQTVQAAMDDQRPNL